MAISRDPWSVEVNPNHLYLLFELIPTGGSEFTPPKTRTQSSLTMRRRSTDHNNSILMAKKSKKSNPQELVFDMMYEILLRIPVEAIGRFRLVCKTWNTIISDPTFQQDHYDHSQHEERLLRVTRTTYRHKANILPLYAHDINDGRGMKTLYMKFPLLESPSHPEIKFIQSCRGLVCLVYKEKHILICNPLTLEMTALPPIGGDYDPIRNSDTIGFGYAAGVKKFKVVRLLREKEKETKCQIFTLGTGVWREGRLPPTQCHEFFNDAPLLHGAIHFMYLPFTDPNVDLSIYALDMQTEEYTLIPLPKSETAGWETRYLKELGGFLHLTFNYGHELKLWILKDYNSRAWVEGYTIDLTGISAITPLAMLRDGSILLDVVDEEDEYGWVLYRYSPGDGGFGPTLPVDYYCSAIMYEESLFAPWK